MLRVCEEREVVEFEADWEGRFRMRIVGWYAAGGGGTTEVPVLEGETISSGMGALLFLHSHVNDSVNNPRRTARPTHASSHTLALSSSSSSSLSQSSGMTCWMGFRCDLVEAPGGYELKPE